LYRRISILCLLLTQAALQADPPPGYYDFAQGKSGADLRSALHGIVRNHHSLPYSGSPHPNTADALGVLDQDPANTNNLIGIYSGYSIATTNIGSASGTWNREHFWCQSYGTSSGPARTDLHHMRPEQANVNSSRGNNYYDQSDPGASGYKTYTNTAAGLVWSRTASTWEPPDMVKGDVARALLYMAIRYTGDAINEPQLTLTDRTNEIVSGNTVMGRYTTLLKWHFADPVTYIPWVVGGDF
jgi:endonuclease I